MGQLDLKANIWENNTWGHNQKYMKQGKMELFCMIKSSSEIEYSKK